MADDIEKALCVRTAFAELTSQLIKEGKHSDAARVQKTVAELDSMTVLIAFYEHFEKARTQTA